MIKRTIIMLCGLLLTGCSVTKETFDCKYSKGVGCRSITEVNTMLNDGKLNLSGSNMVKPKNAPIKDPFQTDNRIVQRVTEQHLRVWVAPHEDEQGNFHEETKVHTVLRTGFWQSL